MSAPALRAPIVLVHGLFGFDRLAMGAWTIAHYFRAIPEMLRAARNRRHVARRTLKAIQLAEAGRTGGALFLGGGRFRRAVAVARMAVARQDRRARRGRQRRRRLRRVGPLRRGLPGLGRRPPEPGQLDAPAG